MVLLLALAFFYMDLLKSGVRLFLIVASSISISIESGIELLSGCKELVMALVDFRKQWQAFKQ